MNCKKCGTQLSADDLFCKGCEATTVDENSSPNENDEINIEQDITFIPERDEKTEVLRLEDIMQVEPSLDVIESEIQPSESEYTKIVNVETPNATSQRYNRTVLIMTAIGILLAFSVISITFIYFLN